MSSSEPDSSTANSKRASRTHLVRKLLKGLETGDPESAAVVNEDKYVQHNPQTAEGGEGLAALFARLSKTNPRVNVVRAFDDDDYVFGMVEYDFATHRVGFEVFRFEGMQAVEHWDNIQPRESEDMTTGPVEAVELDKTEANRLRVRDYVEQILIPAKWNDLGDFIPKDLIQHSPPVGRNGLDALQSFLKSNQHNYRVLHRVLAEGNFCLAVIEGERNGVHTSFYHMYRLHENMLVEQWLTIEEVPPKSEWKNNNGKFDLAK